MVIARRELRLATPEGPRPVEVRIHAPRETDHWICDYEIDWPDAPRRFAGHGADSMQALVIALQVVGAELHTSEHHRAGALSFEGRPGYGFPVPTSLRDLLSGDDANYL